jgi:hypothetical protein
MLLAGHFHIAGTTRTSNALQDRQLLRAHRRSGTTISTRGRGQPNSLNVIQIEPSTIAIAQYRWRAQRLTFDLFSNERFVRDKTGWAPA